MIHPIVLLILVKSVKYLWKIGKSLAIINLCLRMKVTPTSIPSFVGNVNTTLYKIVGYHMGYPLMICSTQTHNVKIFGPGGLKRFFSTSQYFCRSHNFKLPGQNRTKRNLLRGVHPKTCLPITFVHGLTEFTVLLSIYLFRWTGLGPTSVVGMRFQWWCSSLLSCLKACFWDVLGILQGERGPHGRGYSSALIEAFKIPPKSFIFNLGSFERIWKMVGNGACSSRIWNINLQKFAGFPKCMVVVLLYCHKYTLDWSENGYVVALGIVLKRRQWYRES